MDHQSQDIHAHKTGEPHLVGEGEDEHPHEKKTVMQRVKARARRIRSSIRKHVHDDHDQAHDGDQARDVPHDDDDDDDDDEEYDEEVEEDQETHGAPRAKEIEGTPILSSFDKMNIHDESESKPKQHLPTGSHDQFSSEHSSLNPISTTQHLETSQKSSAPISEKIPAVASALADSAVSAKEVVASKVGHGEKNDTETHETTGNYTPQHPKTVEESLGTQKPESNPEHITSPKPASPTSYAQKFSYATSAIYGTAVSAKNAVASTFGYGEKNNTGLQETTGDYDTTSNEPASETETEHRKKMASTETDQHSPLYEKETGEGSEAMSKMHGPENSARELEKSSSETKEQDKGVSIKGYLAEKLVPGDEDRALSEVITDTFNKRKEEPESVPVGKVTVSDHVAKTLGTADEENESNYAIKTRGTVASWFGLSGDGQSPASHDSPTNTKGEKDDKTQERE
uniref:Low-temperature-induced 65 kDa protein n=1 Tax=Cannabis sativa TaxID=3483 RepID=A0A803R2Q4_CANSA